MKRREFITLLASAAAWPLPLGAQPQPRPVVGFLHSGSQSPPHAGFRQGLSDGGFVEGRDVTVEYRYAEGDYDRLPELAAGLVRRQVAALFASGGAHTALAVKAVAGRIPVVFAIGSDPVKFGLVASLNRPGGNVTGIRFFTAELEPKRLGLLHQTVPQATVLGALVNPLNANAENQSKALGEAARVLGLRLHILNASSDDDFEAAFQNLQQQGAGGLLVASDSFFTARRQMLVALAARHRLPAISEFRQFAEAGGLMSYGIDLFDANRQAGVYTARVLKGERPADLPVMQSTKFELVINLKTAKALGVDISPNVLTLADEVIE